MLENYVYKINIDSIIPSAIIGLISRLGLQGILELIFEDINLFLVESQGDSNLVSEKLYFSKDNGGEGSSQNPSGPEKKGGVIGPEDFTYDSDSDLNPHNESEEEKTDNRATGDNTTTFENKVESMSRKEDVSSTKEEIERALATYKSSGGNVPAFKEQVSELEKKLEICDTKLSKLESEEQLESESKGKGKEKEVSQDTTSSKRTANPDDNPGPAPKRVPNPNYLPPAGSAA
jgi:hypothetical protein